MMKQVIAGFVGVITFALGCALVANYFVVHDARPVQVSEEHIAHVETIDRDSPSAACRMPATFPGRSIPLTELTKFKKGYFPIKAFYDGWHNDDTGRNEWYGKFLRVMKEPSLLDDTNENDETYRFLWLRTFDRPVSIRVDRDKNNIHLKAVELSGAGGYDPGQNFRVDHVVLSVEQWCEFIRRLDAAEFWKQETVDRSQIGTDGSEWVLEGVKDRRYHVVDRWRPEEGPFREACLYLLEVSGRNPKTLGADLY